MAYTAYERGETAVLSLSVTDAAGDADDPSNAITITVTDPAGTVVVDAEDMDNDAVGAYHWDYTIAADAVLGTYAAQYHTSDGDPARLSKETDYFFVVKCPMAAWEETSLTFTVDQVLHAIARYKGGADSQSPTDCMEHLIAAYMDVLAGIDARSGARHFWSFLQPQSTITFWATTTGTMAVGGVGDTTITDAANAPFYASMVGATLVADTSGTEYTITAYTSSSIVTVDSDASADDGDTFTITATGEYNPTTTFGGFIDRPVFAYASTGRRYELKERTPEEIYAMWRDEDDAGYTEYFAVVAVEQATDSPQEYRIIVAPIPTEDMEAKFRMRKRVTMPTAGGGEYFPGDWLVAKAIRSAALADAEIIDGDTEGVWATKAARDLVMAIDGDRTLFASAGPQRMGTG
jgi:hypothetical protein